MWNMLNCAEQVKIEKCKTHADPSVPLLMTDFSAFPGTAERCMVVGRLHPQPLRYGIPSLRILDIVPLSQPLKEI